MSVSSLTPKKRSLGLAVRGGSTGVAADEDTLVGPSKGGARFRRMFPRDLLLLRADNMVEPYHKRSHRLITEPSHAAHNEKKKVRL
jgi:hypothetical protein